MDRKLHTYLVRLFCYFTGSIQSVTYWSIHCNLMMLTNQVTTFLSCFSPLPHLTQEESSAVAIKYLVSCLLFSACAIVYSIFFQLIDYHCDVPHNTLGVPVTSSQSQGRGFHKLCPGNSLQPNLAGRTHSNNPLFTHSWWRSPGFFFKILCCTTSILSSHGTICCIVATCFVLPEHTVQCPDVEMVCLWNGGYHFSAQISLFSVILPPATPFITILYMVSCRKWMVHYPYWLLQCS